VAAVDILWKDVRYGLRILVKNPAFTLVAVLTLAFGIGANTAIFSYVSAWILKPLPYPQGDRLAAALQLNTKKGWTSSVSTAADFVVWQQQNRSLDQLAAWSSWRFNLTSDGPPESILGGRVSWNLFRTLGAQPEMGRTFLPEEDQPGAGHVVILGRGLWESRFAGDPRILGRTIQIEGETYSVIGVMPASFQLPLMGRANLWVPLALTEKRRADRRNSWLHVLGRLKPGVTLAQANTDLTAIASRLEKTYPESNTNVSVLLRDLHEELGRHSGNRQVVLSFWIVGLVLVIACANVANLMLARATGRTREFAVRAAIGAGRWRLIRQLLTETALLFMLGGAAGLLVARWGMRWIGASIPLEVRGSLLNYGQVSLDLPTLGYVLLLALTSGILFGLAPALQSSKFDLNVTLKDAAGRSSGSRRTSRLRSTFVAGEIALAVVVLVCSSLLIQNFFGIVHTDPGFRPENVLVAQLQLPARKYTQPEQVRAFYDQVINRIRALPQVSAVGASEFVPFSGSNSVEEISVVGRPKPKPGEEIGAEYAAVTPEYFRTVQIGLIEGRFISAEDGPTAPPVVVINQTMARRLWPQEDPIGQQIRIGPRENPFTIIGVVRDIKLSDLSDPWERQLYVSAVQFPEQGMGIVVRSPADTALAPMIRGIVWSVDKDQPVALRSLEQFINEENAPGRILMQLMVFFGVLTLLLAAIGIYGVMSYTVTQRTQEIGIRLALGAQPGQLIRLFVGRGLKLSLWGIGIGIALALVAARFLSFMLFEARAWDPATFIGTALLLTLVALLACWLPTRRAVRVDPMKALRYE
jgi:putative ABC transport system permease protein